MKTAGSSHSRRVGRGRQRRLTRLRLGLSTAEVVELNGEPSERFSLRAPPWRKASKAPGRRRRQDRCSRQRREPQRGFGTAAAPHRERLAA
jgi:hypothetical protein